MRIPLFGLAFALAFAMTATAQPSPVCKPVIDATHKQSTTPSHVVIVQSGHANAEVIYLPDATYMKFPQGWMKTGPGFKDDPPDQKDNPDKVYECRRLPHAVVDGVAAIVFAVHTVSDTSASEGTIWIAKASGLPIKSEGDTTSGGRKVHVSSTWTYDNIRAPTVK